MSMHGMTYRDLDKTVAQAGAGVWQEKQDGRAGGLKRKERPGQWTSPARGGGLDAGGKW